MMKKLLVFEVMVLLVGATAAVATGRRGAVGLAVSKAALVLTGEIHGCCSSIGEGQDAERSIAGEVSILSGSLTEGKTAPAPLTTGSRGVDV